MKETPFTATHIALGAKMADFAGFNMPIQYPTGINQEHMIVREGVGVFDLKEDDLVGIFADDYSDDADGE